MSSTTAVPAPVTTPVATAADPKAPKQVATVIKVLTADEVKALSAEQVASLGKAKKHVRSIFPDSRAVRYLSEQYMNAGVHRRSSVIDEKLAPVKSWRAALETKREPQYDAAGKPLLGEDGKTRTVELTEARTRELVAKIEAAKSETTALEDEARALKEISFRFSNKLGGYLRDVIVTICSELLRAAADQCLLEDKKIITTQMLMKNAKNLICLYLIQHLPSWRSPPEPKQKKADAAVPEEEPSAAADAVPAESDEGSPTYLYYLTEMCSELAHPTQLDADGNPVTEIRLIKDKNGIEKYQRVTKHSDSVYHSLRTSGEFKAYLNTLIFEFYASISPMLQNQLISLNVKTLDEEILMDVVRGMMLFGQPAREEIVYSKVMASDPAQVAELKKINKAAREAKTPLDPRKEKDLPQIEVTEAKKRLVYDDARYEKFQEALAAAAKLWVTVPPPAAATPVTPTA